MSGPNEAMVSEEYDLCIVGGGMAAERLLCQLEASSFKGSVVLIGEEPVAGYNRVLLPDLLSGSCAWQDIAPRSRSGDGDPWYQMRLGVRAVKLDCENRSVTDADGTTVRWSTLVLATGSRVAIPKVLRTGSSNVQALRTLEDVKRLQAPPESAPTVAVVGGGLLGLEASYALMLLGWRVVVLHRSEQLMNRQLHGEPAALLAKSLRKLGLEIRLGVEVAGLMEDDRRVIGLHLSDGTSLNVDRVVTATGNQANLELAQSGGLHCNQGVVVDDQMRTSKPSVYAIGECAEMAGQTHCFVEPVYAQADALARGFSGEGGCVQIPSASTRLKVAGIELFCAGNRPVDSCANQSSTNLTSASIQDDSAGVYRNLMFRDDMLAGAVLLGDTRGSRAITAALNTRVSGNVEREKLLFGVTSSFG